MFLQILMSLYSTRSPPSLLLAYVDSRETHLNPNKLDLCYQYKLTVFQ